MAQSKWSRVKHEQSLFKRKSTQDLVLRRFGLGQRAVYSAIDEQVVPFALNRPRERRTTRVDLSKGSTTLTSVMDGWVADETNIWVTTNPYGQALAHASHIIRYPYGCVEQAASKLRPLISSRGLYSSLIPAKPKIWTSMTWLPWH